LGEGGGEYLDQDQKKDRKRPNEDRREKPGLIRENIHLRKQQVGLDTPSPKPLGEEKFSKKMMGKYVVQQTRKKRVRKNFPRQWLAGHGRKEGPGEGERVGLLSLRRISLRIHL